MGSGNKTVDGGGSAITGNETIENEGGGVATSGNETIEGEDGPGQGATDGENGAAKAEKDGVINPPVTIGEGTDASVGNETIQGEDGVTGGEGAIGGDKSRESSSLPKGNVTAAQLEGDGEDYHNDEKRAKGKSKHHHIKKKNKKKKGGHKRSQDAAK